MPGEKGSVRSSSFSARLTLSFMARGSGTAQAAARLGVMTVDGYLAGVRGALRRALGDRLVGVWLAGSAALGDFDPARRDLDVLAIAADPIAASELRALAAAVQEGASGCPARGIELVLYTRDGLADPA